MARIVHVCNPCFYPNFERTDEPPFYRRMDGGKWHQCWDESTFGKVVRKTAEFDSRKEAEEFRDELFEKIYL